MGTPPTRIFATPARGVERFPERVDIGRAHSPGELRAIWEALKGEDSIQADAVRVVLLSGLRPSEVRLLTWEKVGDGGRVLRLAKWKTGARVAYVGPRAGAIIREQPELSALLHREQRECRANRGHWATELEQIVALNDPLAARVPLRTGLGR